MHTTILLVPGEQCKEMNFCGIMIIQVKRGDLYCVAWALRAWAAPLCLANH